MRAELRSLAHAGLTFNAPLSDSRADLLARRLPIAPGRHVLDLACGWAELLLRIVAAHPATTGTGVDRDRAALDRGRREVYRRGLHGRVELVEGDARTFEDRGDLVVCVGAAHIWGSTTAALRALRAHLEPGGLLLFADGFWERPPGAEARRLHGDLPVWEGLLAVCASTGFVVVEAERSTLQEWDDFEACWRRGLERSDDPEARLLAIDREREYRDACRGTLGFAWLVLASR